jgi:TATA-box binding protein (TBP) (component of TFIID and TFIIIB)
VDDHKKINFKLSKNGKLQLTGCKNDAQPQLVVQKFIDDIIDHCRDCIELHQGQETIRIFFQTVMTNIDFSLGFCVDRQKLDFYINKDTPFHSLLETSFGYTGVNIKFPMDEPWWKCPVVVITRSLNSGTQWSSYCQPLDSLTAISSALQNKKKYNTFLVFHSGSVIMSGMQPSTMKTHFDLFISVIKTWRPNIEEKIRS